MSLRSVLSAVRRQGLFMLSERTAPWGNRGPVVSFSFDDFPQTAYSNGGAILGRFGGRGTYYAAMGLMNASNELGQHFSSDDLQGLLRDGHELASHTYGHISCRAVSCSSYINDVDRGRKAIEEVAGRADSGNFAYPFGDVTYNTKRTLGPALRSSRSIFPGINGPDVDLNLLLANRLYGDLDQLGDAQRLILENEQRKGWLIFYTHDVRPNFSPYGCSPSLLESTVSFAVERGCRVLTVQAALAGMGVGSA